MSRPQLQTKHLTDTRAPAPAKPRDDTPKPLAVTGVMTRRPSPVHGLHSDLESAFARDDGERKIPFAITLAGVSAFSLTCWTLLFLLVRAL